jgi:TRAP-type C4-dicarboxylate transport system substrate-binding protein
MNAPSTALPWLRHLARPLLLAALVACTGLAPRADAAPKLQVVVGGTSFRNTIGEAHWLAFQRNAVAASGGELDVKMLIHGELGSEENIVSGLRRGRVQYANLSALIATTIVPELSLLYMPYLFESRAEADYVLDTYLTREYSQLLARRGLELMVLYDLDFQQIWSRKKPILVPADARGMRFRVAASKSAELLGRSIGADLIPLPFADIIPSLQTGLIEAGENGVTLYSRTGTAPEAPHLTITDHSLAMSLIVADKRWFDRLDPRYQKSLRGAFPVAAQIRRDVRAEIESDYAQAAKLGYRVYRLTPAQRAQWIATTRTTHNELLRDAGGDSARLYAGIQQARKAFAAARAAAPPAATPGAAPASKR